MSNQQSIVGWDVGGAHLKLAQVDAEGRLVRVRQIPCPLWRGIATLDKAFAIALPMLGAQPCRHVVTMTGELSDIFIDRRHGVQILAQKIADVLGSETMFFGGSNGFIPASEVQAGPERVASANWLATGRFVAQRVACCVLIDVGSTTTDLVLIDNGCVSAQGYSDAERLSAQELIYTGVVRTPVMAVVQAVPFAGQWQGLMAEQFATMADVHVLTESLTNEMLREQVHFETSDGGGTGVLDCARRLARMLGRDLNDAEWEPWRAVAGYIAERQLDQLMQGVWRISSRSCHDSTLRLVGAGVGRFVVQEAARRLRCDYIDLASWFHGQAPLPSAAAVCAPAVSLAYLMRDAHA